jgi:hypothetical protein
MSSSIKRNEEEEENEDGGKIHVILAYIDDMLIAICQM